MKQKTFVEYKGEPIYYNDNHYGDECEFWDEMEGNYTEEDMPESFEVEICDTEKIGHNLSPDGIIEDLEYQMLCEMEDDSIVTVHGKDELREALRVFLDKQDPCYVPSGKFAIIKRSETC
jgi:hypothetical protein